MIKVYIGVGIAILIVGIAIGITGTMIARHCNIDEAMKPLVYVIGELSGRNCR